ncbi:hypothetical protein GGI43DRAFT_405825 [Trichoderma evansii]
MIILSFNELMQLVPDPNLYRCFADCAAQSNVPSSAINSALTQAGTLSSQPNQVWLPVRFRMRNQ